jgi:hypothetical protein
VGTPDLIDVKEMVPVEAERSVWMVVALREED